jgi:uncharacterized glyoxalase superfamily protein PhnB
MSKNVNKMTPLLQVFDMKVSVAYYRDTLGFTVVNTYEPEGHFYWASLELGNAALMLNAAFEDNNRPEKMAPARIQGHGDIELYFEVKDVQAVYDRLKKKGVSVKEPVNTHYNTREIRLTDPDGYKLRFYQEMG